MYPTLIHIPLLEVALPSYETFILLAAVLCIWVGPRWAERLEGLDRSQTRRALLVIGVLVFAGGRLHFVLNHWFLFANRPWLAFKLWSGGMHAGGAIAALALGTPLVLRRFGIPIGKFADSIAPTVGIGIGIARLGCFLKGCCFGLVCDWPWALSFPRSAYVYRFHQKLGLLPADALTSAPIHPLQLYFSAAGFLLTGIALWMYRRKRYDGHVALVVLLAYSISAAILEFLRADYIPRTYWGPLPQLEWTALVLIASSLVGLAVARHSFGPRPERSLSR